MEKWIQKLSGALIASALALTLSSRASADLQPEEDDPDQPLPQYEEKLAEDDPDEEPGSENDDPSDGDHDPEDNGGFTAFSLSSGDTDGNGEDGAVLPGGDDAGDGIVLFSSDDPGDGLPAEGDSGDPGDTGDTGDTGSDTEPGTVSIGDTTFTPGVDPSIDLSGDTTEDENDLFGFDAGASDDASDDSFYMVNYDGSGESLTSENSDINIVAAGLNQLGSIIADGDVNITGTGILLVDEIQLAEGCGFFLHPIDGMYESGSVAVFLLTSPADSTNGTNAVYTLLNPASMPGILDEEYTIPDGITLVIPSGSSLILESLMQETIDEHPDENGEMVPSTVTVYPSSSIPDLVIDHLHHYKVTAANLNIPASSSLLVEEGASITANSFATLGGTLVIPRITVSGTLEGAGIITGGVVVFNGQAVIDAVFQDSMLYNNAQDISLAIFGECSLVSYNGSSISQIILAEDAELSCYVNEFYTNDCSVLLTGSILGEGSIALYSGHYIVTNPDFVLEDSVTVSAMAVTIEDSSGQFAQAVESGPAIIFNPENPAMPGSDAIPVLPASITDKSHLYPSDAESWWGSVSSDDAGFLPADLAAGDVVSFSDLVDAYWDGFPENALYCFIEVYTVSNGKLVRHLINLDENGNYTEGSVPVDEIWLIRPVTFSAISDSGAGGSVMSTNTSMTGSGIIGGSGAGSISGGSGIELTIPTGNNGNGNGDNGNGNGDNGNGSEDPSPPVNPQPAPQQNVVVTVTQQDPAGQQAASLEEIDSVFTLSAVSEGQTLTGLSGTVTVRFTCPAPKTGGMIFAVFRNDDGSLKVFRARYDRISGQLVFQTDMLGDFAVVCIDYDGELYSEEFYALLESFDSVRSLD